VQLGKKRTASDLGAPLPASGPEFQTSYRRELFPPGIDFLAKVSCALVRE
jgi:hypothetical protein